MSSGNLRIALAAFSNSSVEETHHKKSTRFRETFRLEEVDLQAE